jgi:hypothetical protein
VAVQDVLSHSGIAPLRQGGVDELCYRSESPLLAYWVLFGAGDAGDYEKLTQFRVLSAPRWTSSSPKPARGFALLRTAAVSPHMKSALPIAS